MHTERLHVKLMTTDLIDDNILSWFKDEELMKYYTNSKQEITKNKLVKSIQEGRDTGTIYNYLIYFSKDERPIGILKIGPINKAHRISDLVTLIGDRRYMGKGIGTEAITLGNRVAFEKYDLRKLFGGMYANNIASVKAYTRASWVVEGVLRGHYLENNKNEDRVLVGCFNPKYFTIEEIELAKDENWYRDN